MLIYYTVCPPQVRRSFAVSDDKRTAEKLFQKVRVLCYVPVTDDEVNTTIEHIMNTWGKHCNNITFFVGEAHSHSPVNELPVNRSPVNELPVKESVDSGLHINALPVNESPVNESPVSDLPDNELPVNEIPGHKLRKNILPVTRKSIHELPVVRLLGVQDNGRYNLTKKMFEAMYYLYRNELDKYDWFLKADTDTYIVVKNLRYLLSDYHPSVPIYFGHQFTVSAVYICSLMSEKNYPLIFFTLKVLFMTIDTLGHF